MRYFLIGALLSLMTAFGSLYGKRNPHETRPPTAAEVEHIREVGTRLYNSSYGWLGEADVYLRGEKVRMKVLVDTFDFKVLPALDQIPEMYTSELIGNEPCFRADLIFYKNNRQFWAMGSRFCPENMNVSEGGFVMRWPAVQSAIPDEAKITELIASVDVPLPNSTVTAPRVQAPADPQWKTVPQFKWIPLSQDGYTRERGQLITEYNRRGRSLASRRH